MARDFCHTYGMMARPGATWLESAVIAAISYKRSLLNSGLASQVWARECWSSGEKRRKKLLRQSKRINP